VQVEFLEIKADAEFEKAIFDKRFPKLSAAAGNSVWRREFAQVCDVLAPFWCLVGGGALGKFLQVQDIENMHQTCKLTRLQYSNIFRSRDNFKRVALASLVMFFQQWTGIDSSKPFLDILF
jgi:hypothetical protein